MPAQLALRVPRSMSAPTKRGDHYRSSVVKSPVSLLVPVFATLFLAACGWPTVLLVLALQLACWLVLPRLAWFRAQVDEADAALERHEVAAARAALLQRMDEPHRRAFEHLQSLVADVGERLAGDDHRESGLRWLLSRYLELALAHRAARQHPICNGRVVLLDEIAALDARARSAAPPLTALLEQRMLIAQRRLARLDQTTADLECMTMGLAAIDAMVHLAHESTLGPRRAHGLRLEIDAAIAEFTGDRSPPYDPVAQSSVDDTIDPRILEGRAPQQHAHGCG